MITSKIAYNKNSLTYCLRLIKFAVTKNSQCLRKSKRRKIHRFVDIATCDSLFVICFRNLIVIPAKARISEMLKQVQHDIEKERRGMTIRRKSRG